MKKILILSMLTLSLSCLGQDAERCNNSEPGYLNRMPGFYISDCKNSDFSEKTFVYYVNGKASKLTKAGKYYEVWYSKNTGETRKFSSAQLKANYTNAVLKAKGNMLSSEGSSEPVYSASINGKEVYIKISAGNSEDLKSYHIAVIEADQMKQELTFNLGEALDRDGKATLYGILFDVNKSDIKPESAEALTQITEYLKANPSIKIIVVGHTDNTGVYADNFILSKARAESIKKYLVEISRIDASRILSEGVGSVCPVAANTTEDGRKLNRRVEIVKQ